MTVPEKAFSLRIGDYDVVIKPDPEHPGKSLVIINGELYRADFRYRIPSDAEDSEGRAAAR